MIKKRNILFKLLFFFFLLIGVFNCSETSPTVNPADSIQAYVSNETGTEKMTSSIAYPSNGATGVPVDANIVITFSKIVDIDNPNVTTEISVSGGVTYPNPGSDSNVLTIDPVADLAYNTTYTITVGTGLTSTDLTTIDKSYSWSFTTVTTDTSSNYYPYVLPLTRNPAEGATSVSTDLSYVDVTFNKSVTPGTVTTGTFTISPAVAGSSVSQIGSTNSYRLTLGSKLLYNTVYTIDLTSAITDGTNSLVQDGNDTWTFTTETDATITTTNPSAITNTQTIDVTDTTSEIQFNTDYPADITKCKVRYGTAAGTLTSGPIVESNWDGGSTSHSFHKISLGTPVLIANTVYYYKVWYDTNGDGVIDGGEPQSAELSFVTATAVGTGGKIISNAANNQNGFETVQLPDGSSYIFWVDNATDIKGQFFNTDGSVAWTVGGIDIANTGNLYDSVVAINSKSTNNDVLVIFKKDDNSLYSKKIYNNGGTPTFTMGSDGSTESVDIGISIKAGSEYDVCLVHERPEIITSGNADKPATMTNLIFDKDTDFSTTASITDGDKIFWNTAGVDWTEDTISGTDSWGVFKYLARISGANPGVRNDYYIIDSETSVLSGTADHITSTTQFELDGSSGSGEINVNDIIKNTTDTKYGVVSAVTNPGSTYHYDITMDRDILLDVTTDNIEIYYPILSNFTSEAISNPLWDDELTDPQRFQNGTKSVNLGDYVINENDNTGFATSATVNVIDNDYALQLSSDIMNNNDIYSIIRTPSSSTYRAVGYSTAITSFRLVDSNTNLGGVQIGDVVFNIDQDKSARVTKTINATTLELSSNIFDAINNKYMIYQKRGFLIVYVDGSDNIVGKVLDISDGSQITASFDICTSGINSNPHVVSDGAGGAIVVYNNGGNVYAKKVSAKGSFLWSHLDADQATDVGIQIMTAQSVSQVLSDYSDTAPMGAFITGENSINKTVQLLRLNGDTGGVTWDTGSIANAFSPHIAIDKITGQVANVLATYTVIHTVDSNDYEHVGMSSFNGVTGVVNYPAILITEAVTSKYYCLYPKIVVSDTTGGLDDFYVTWYDGRYYSSLGYAIYSQKFDNSGVAQWSSDLFVISPSSYGLVGQLMMDVLFYDDDSGTDPYGIIPIWQDFRQGASNSDIYYEDITDDGTP